MSAISELSKPFPLSGEILRVIVIGRNENGRFIPPDGTDAALVEIFKNVSQEESQNYPSDSILILPDDKLIARIATVFENEILPEFGAPESPVLENPNLKNKAIEEGNNAINSSGLYTANESNLDPNISSEETVGGLSTQASAESPSAPPRIRNNRDIGSSYISYPSDMLDGQDKIQFEIFEYKFKKLGSENADIIAGIIGNVNKSESERYEKVGGLPTVFLPISNKITDTNSVDWADDTVNDFQLRAAGISLGSMSGGPDEAITQIDMINKYLNEKGGDAAVANAVRLSLASAAVSANNLLTRGTGAIINPNLELLFQRPQLRSFTFNFSLAGKSERESSDIKKIIKFFKSNMSVRTEEGPGYFLKSPYVFKIKYLLGAKEDHPSMNKIKMCALQNCSVDYTPMGSYMTYNDKEGSMFMYSLSLQFKELTPVYDTDYDSHPIGY